ncbi:tautomerase family protein [Mycobacterium sp. CVI_P3]|uniref:Tautomerase family protein n=1 Tax=Mycobacterium pinniadriaticum TaxID=2994102 RepID=A0ABT3SF29_9MYCO|nr:tautomerase family protein [Mycobacterium pinniadriaticum]MCX2931808.1 tautomerase family protein [Mycobacterium pinniadriaticum]MCX2938117.1 tautomerase family protein [Mycobacterium pinniadriaticum]
MPMIQINLLAGHTDAEKRALLSAVTHAVMTSIGAKQSSVRVWISELEPTEIMIAGEVVADKRSQPGTAT